MKNKFIDFNRVTLNQKILIAVIVLIILILTTNIISLVTKQQNKMFDYKNITAIDIILTSDTTNDREIYWTLNGIITEFIRSYSAEIKIPTDMIEYDYKNYYNALTPEYQGYLSKSKYEKLAKDMLNKFVGNTNNYNYIRETDLINKIYIVSKSKNMYMCSLKTEVEGTESYIGIMLDTKNNIYNIFYLE